jgi:hypothetical protein
MVMDRHFLKDLPGPCHHVPSQSVSMRRDIVHAIQTAGLVALDPSPWRALIPEPVRLKYLQTENQIFDVIRENSVDILALEVEWFTDLQWLPAILEQAHLSRITMVFLIQGPPRMLKVTASSGILLREIYAPNQCVHFDFGGHQAFHKGIPMTLPWRSVQLLALLSDSGERTMDCAQASVQAKEVLWAPWTESLMKVHIFQIRKELGVSHIATVPKRGYRFIPCGLEMAAAPLKWPAPRISTAPTGKDVAAQWDRGPTGEWPWET